MRDWQDTLWPASFGGFPFFVEKNKDQFGKKVVVHEFPNRDGGFAEDLGQKSDHHEISAYLASDSADFDAAALKATLKSYGVQTLVLPDEGPIACIFKDGSREHERDRLGWIGFSLNFVAQGASAPIVSGDYFAQLAADAVGGLAAGAESLMGNLGL